MDNCNNINDNLKNDILLLIMDYLYSTNLIDSLITIEQESKLSIFSYNKELSFLRKLILKGNWNEAENFLLPLKSNPIFNFSSAIYYLKLQKFFETTEVESSNYDQNEIELQLKEIRNYSTEEQFKELLNLLNKNTIKEEPKYKNWTINCGRLKTFEKIRELMGVIYPINKEKEKIIKDNLLMDFCMKIIGNEKIEKNKIIKEIISVVNSKNFIYNKKSDVNNTKKPNNKNNEYGNKNNDEYHINNNNNANTNNKDELNNKNKSPFKEKQKGKDRPQSSLGTKNKKTEIDASLKIDKKANKNINKNDISNNNKNKESNNNKNIINNDNISSNIPINNINENINLDNTNISNIPNYTETSSLIKDTKKLINNLSERNQNNKNSDQKTIISPNLIHHKIESDYDLYSYEPSSFSMDSLIVDSHAIRAISFSPNGELLSLGTNSKSLKFYDFSPINEKFLRKNSSSDDFISLNLLFEKPNHHAGSIYCLDFSPNNKLVATGSNDKMIKIFVIPDFSTKTREILELAIPDQHGTVRSVVFSPIEENNFFSGGSGDTNIYMWDTESGKRINSLNGHEKDINSLKFSVDDNCQIKLLGSCGNDNNVCFHDFRTNNPVKKIKIENHGEINDITFSNDFVCSVHNDGYICLYNNNISQNIVKEFKVSNKEIRAINFSKDGKFLLTASFDNKICIFDINDEMKMVKSLAHDDRAVNCKWHPNKPIIASSSADKTARIWTPKVY